MVKNNGPRVSPDVEVSDVPGRAHLRDATSSRGPVRKTRREPWHCQIGQMNVDDEVTIHLTTAVGAGHGRPDP